MRMAFAYILIGLLSVFAGLSATHYALERGIQFNELKFGVWSAWPLAGETGADPYSRALFARRGSIWMSTREGLVFIAGRDATGERLSALCQYTLAGTFPRARLWSLAAEALTQDDEISNQPKFSHITSENVVWNEDQTVEIGLSDQPLPGNWLALPSATPFQLVLRLYDTPLTSGGLSGKLTVPTLVRGDCRS